MLNGGRVAGTVDVGRCLTDAAYFNSLDPEKAARALILAGLDESGFSTGTARGSTAGSGVSAGGMRYATDAKDVYRGGQVTVANGITRLHANPATRRKMCEVAACWTKEAFAAYSAEVARRG